MNKDLQQEKNGRLIIILLIIANTLANMSMDVHLPLAPTIMIDLQTTEMMVQALFIISVVLTTTTPLFWGPLSDSYGRRTLFLPASFLMVIGQFGCSLAPTIEWLLFARVIQYLGVGAVLTVALAVICDLYTGTKRARMIALLEMSVPFALVIAPILGAYTALYLSWRYNFLILGLLQAGFLAVLMQKMPETLKSRKEFKWKSSYQALSSVLSNRSFMQYVLLFATVNASYMIFITNASFLYINGLGLSPTLFALSQSSMIFVYFIGLVLYRWLASKYSTEAILNASMIGYGIYGFLVFIILSKIIPFNIFTSMGTMLVSCLVSGPIITSCNSLALGCCKDHLGTSSATIEFTIGSVAGCFMLLSSYIFNQTFVPVYAIIGSTIVLSLAIWFNLSFAPSVLSKEQGL